MAITVQTQAYLSQLGLITFVDPTGGPEGPHHTVAYRLVPTSGWLNSQRFPHNVTEDLKQQNYNKTTLEGIEYYLVPEESTNTPGVISHYAQRTGVSDLKNPIEADTGHNRALDTFKNNDDYSAHTVAPDAVQKYVKENDSWDEARQKSSERDERVLRQIGHGEGEAAPAPAKEEKPAPPAPKKDK